VATQLEAGHAPNALPQKASAHVQCRLLPGEDTDGVQRALVQAIADPEVTVTEVRRHGDDATVVSRPPPLTADILGPAERIAARHFPGTPVIPKLLTAGTDGRYLSAAGIPTYGIPGILLDRNGNGAHGIHERVGVDSVFRGRDYLYDLIRAYAGAAVP
jgi:acetylornithine deacetylase/succinyl-diaminopimelate desuccinylase-like protein